MWIKRICVALIFVLAMNCVLVPANADEVGMSYAVISAREQIVPFATESLSITIPAKTNALARFSYNLAADEAVTIKASYTPFSASIDVGLVTSDGRYYYYSATNGSINKTIQVSESGAYTLLIRNNSNYEVQVSGYVNY